MSQSAAELTVQDLRDMRRSFSRQELLDLIDRMFTNENAALDMDVVDAAIFRLLHAARTLSSITAASRSARVFFMGCYLFSKMF